MDSIRLRQYFFLRVERIANGNNVCYRFVRPHHAAWTNTLGRYVGHIVSISVCIDLLAEKCERAARV